MAAPSHPRLLQPLRDFLRTEAAGGAVLVGAAIVALIWANSPWSDSYAELWERPLVVDLGVARLDLELRDWINDGLMAVFFFVVGLEIKRELVEGELRDPRRAALPAVAAVGGMAVPALIYLVVNAGGDSARGWGIPVATDIAMAVGVMSLLGGRVDPAWKLFLLALAIVDDVGAIVLIAVFYADGAEGGPALVALGVVGLIVALQRAGVAAMPVYVVLALALWLAVHESGVHATIAGVALGLLTPVRPTRRADVVDAADPTDDPTRSVSVVEWLEHRLHPWSSFVIVPVFALANAGVSLSGDALAHAGGSPITVGVVTGLVAGKLLGVTAATWLAVRTGIGELPPRTPWRAVIGIGALAGIGFTVSIFVTGLAFADAARQDEAKLGVLAASVLAAVLGTLVLRRASGGTDRQERSAARSRA